MSNYIMKKLALLLFACSAGIAAAETPLNYKGEILGNVSDGDFAPYYMMSNNGGVLTQGKTFQARAAAWKDLDLSRRFSYSFGADVVAGASSEVDYLQHNGTELQAVGRKPAAAWIQQLYGEIKYRGVFLSVGMKERTSPLLNSQLGVGDYTQSNNARPLPEVRIGFVDFQDIPLTKGWIQIQGEIAYGKYLQNDWLKDHFNYAQKFITEGVWFHYKRAYFRTKPSKPLSVTVGMQSAAQFGGTAYTYINGQLTKTDPYDTKLKDFFRIFVPGSGGSNVGDTQYMFGNTLGSWDFLARYRFKDDTELKAYFQFPYEDGSGIGKLNGFDGIYGLEYKSCNPSAIVSGAVIEYIDFTNQSGPSHWAPADNPESTMTGEATGSDNYYNNFRYNGYTNYGMLQGTPFVPGTIYNKDGYLLVKDNRLRGFHAGISGTIYEPLQYRLLVSYRKSWGTYTCPRTETAHDTSVMLEGVYSFRQVKGLQIKGQLAIDRGNLLGDNFGALLSVSYQGILNIFKK